MGRVLWTPPTVNRVELVRGLGALELVPEGMTFPTPVDYTRITSQGFKGLVDMGQAEIRQVMTPAGEKASALFGSIIESATGTSLGSLVAGSIPGGKIVDAFRGVISDAIDGAIEMVIEAVTETVADSIGSVLEIIPMLGKILSLVVDIVAGMLNYSADQQYDVQYSREATKRAAMQKLQNILLPKCTAELAYAQQNITSTSTAGATPSDMFRPIYYRWKRGGGPLPLTPMSLIVMLCGPEADGWAFTQSTYDQFIAEARTGVMYDYAEESVPLTSGGTSERYRWHDRFVGLVDESKPDLLMSNPMVVQSTELNRLGRQRGRSYPCEQQLRDGKIVPDPGLGLKPNVRRRMWELVLAIFSATQDPSASSFARWGDGGRSAMTMLLDILFRHYEPVARGLFGDKDGYWTPFLAKCMEHRITTMKGYRMSKSSVDPESGRRYRAVGSCPVPLMEQFVGIMNDYKEQFIPQFLDQNGNWLSRPKFSLKPAAARSSLLLNSSAANRLADRLAGEQQLSNAQRALLAAAGLSGSYLIYRGTRGARRRRS